MLHESDCNLPEGECKCVLSDPREREMKHCHRYLKDLYPISLPSFAHRPIRAGLLLICELQSSKYLLIIYRAGILILRGVITRI